MSDPRWSDETERVTTGAMLVELNAWDGEPDDRLIGVAVARAALAALADAGWLSRTRTWYEGDPEPADVKAVLDTYNDVWKKVDGGWLLTQSGTKSHSFSWAYITEYAPLQEVTS